MPSRDYAIRLVACDCRSDHSFPRRLRVTRTEAAKTVATTLFIVSLASAFIYINFVLGDYVRVAGHTAVMLSALYLIRPRRSI